MQTLWEHYWEGVIHEVVSDRDPAVSNRYAGELRELELRVDTQIEEAAIAIGL